MAAATVDAAAGRIVDAKDNSNIQIEWGLSIARQFMSALDYFKLLTIASIYLSETFPISALS